MTAKRGSKSYRIHYIVLTLSPIILDEVAVFTMACFTAFNGTMKLSDKLLEKKRAERLQDVVGNRV